MLINDKKTSIESFEEIAEQNEGISKYENILIMTGLGDETIWRCMFSSGLVVKIEFMPNEFKVIHKYLGSR